MANGEAAMANRKAHVTIFLHRTSSPCNKNGGRTNRSHDMSRLEKLQQIRELQEEANRIRNELHVSSPGMVLYYAPVLPLEDEMMVVVANGFGGATTSIVEGNYPIDFVIHHEKEFDTEEAAVVAASNIVEERVNAAVLLG
jgi:hypothetical protein